MQDLYQHNQYFIHLSSFQIVAAYLLVAHRFLYNDAIS